MFLTTDKKYNINLPNKLGKSDWVIFIDTLMLHVYPSSFTVTHQSTHNPFPLKLPLSICALYQVPTVPISVSHQ